MIVTQLESHQVFADVRPQTLDAFRSVFSARTFPRSSIIFDQGDQASSLLLVVIGRVALHRLTPCGKEIAPALIGPGGIAGADALFEPGGMRTMRAVALTETSGLIVGASDVMRILAHDGTVAANIVRALCLQHEATVATFEELATLNVLERIARFFSRLAMSSGAGRDETLRVGLPLTHQQIAAFVSSSRETVSLEMGRLARSGRIVRDRDGYAIRRDP